jgi:hypothetical protein
LSFNYRVIASMKKISIFFAVCLLGAGVIFWLYEKNTSSKPTALFVVGTPLALINEKQATSVIEGGWQTYRSEKFKFEINVPRDGKIFEQGSPENSVLVDPRSDLSQLEIKFNSVVLSDGEGGIGERFANSLDSAREILGKGGVVRKIGNLDSLWYEGLKSQPNRLQVYIYTGTEDGGFVVFDCQTTDVCRKMILSFRMK